jgi:sRNA-binding regulator protein Hfq
MQSKSASKPARAPGKSSSEEKVVDRSKREQYRFLDYCVQNKVEVTVFTITGATFIGIVYAHDEYTMLFGGRSERSHKRLIRKSFISIIVPKENLNLFAEYAGMGTAHHRKRRGVIKGREGRPGQKT